MNNFESYAKGYNQGIGVPFKDDYMEIIKNFGEKNQIEKLGEELDELHYEITRDNPDIKEVKQEIADVLNMINQFLIINDISMIEIKKIMQEKNQRTIGRMRDE